MKGGGCAEGHCDNLTGDAYLDCLADCAKGGAIRRKKSRRVKQYLRKHKRASKTARKNRKYKK
jgi:hypothetical protein